MNRLRNVRLPVPRAPVLKRKMSNWFEKNIYIEENAGMREKSVETFELTVQNCFEFFIFMVVPGYFIYDVGIKELTLRDKDRGCHRAYGLLPPAPKTFREMSEVRDN